VHTNAESEERRKEAHRDELLTEHVGKAQKSGTDECHVVQY